LSGAFKVLAGCLQQMTTEKLSVAELTMMVFTRIEASRGGGCATVGTVNAN
jgi:hypothetical protein